jgi:phosphoribosylformylglycinamidine synthase
MAQLVRACQGLYDAVVAFGTPLISGKDSMKNDSSRGGVKISVPPTLLVSAIGQIDDVRRSRTLEPKASGDLVYLIGKTRDELGGSEFYRYLGECDGLDPAPSEPQPYVGRRPPTVDPERLLPLYRAFEKASDDGLLRSAGTPSLGGWGPLFGRCVMASGLGLELDLGDACRRAELSPERFMFSESNGRFLVTLRASDRDRFETCFDGLPLTCVGAVAAQPHLKISCGEQSFCWNAADLSRAFKETFADD